METFQDQEGLFNQADTRHGHLCPFVSLGVKEGQYAMTAMNQRHTGIEMEVAIIECNNCFTAGILMVTGCTLATTPLSLGFWGRLR